MCLEKYFKYLDFNGNIIKNKQISVQDEMPNLKSIQIILGKR